MGADASLSLPIPLLPPLSLSISFSILSWWAISKLDTTDGATERCSTEEKVIAHSQRRETKREEEEEEEEEEEKREEEEREEMSGRCFLLAMARRRACKTSKSKEERVTPSPPPSPPLTFPLSPSFSSPLSALSWVCACTFELATRQRLKTKRQSSSKKSTLRVFCEHNTTVEERFVRTLRG